MRGCCEGEEANHANEHTDEGKNRCNYPYKAALLGVYLTHSLHPVHPLSLLALRGPVRSFSLSSGAIALRSGHQVPVHAPGVLSWPERPGACNARAANDSRFLP